MKSPQTLKNPPWSGQTVSAWVRVLAGVFVACGLLAVAGASVMTYSDVVQHGKAMPAFTFDLVVNLVAGTYLWLVFLRTFVRGRAPKTWWPWD